MLVTSFSSPLLLIVKLFFIVSLGIYIVFALVILRQTQIMGKTVKLPFEILIKILALIHFIFACTILVLILLYL